MKRKQKTVKQRNPFVVLALKRRAGAHEKTYKAIRKQMKQSLRGCDETGYHSGLLIRPSEFESRRPYHSEAH